VSADHCQVSYDNHAGWSISEKGKDKLSSNGTFVFMKSHQQMTEHEPSDLIPLYDGMVLSFINYEIRVNLEKKDSAEVAKEQEIINGQNQEMEQAAASFKSTMKAQAVHAVAAPVEAAEERKEEPAQEVAPVDTPKQEEVVQEAAQVQEQVAAEEPAQEVAQQVEAAEEAPKE